MLNLNVSKTDKTIRVGLYAGGDEASITTISHADGICTIVTLDMDCKEPKKAAIKAYWAHIAEEEALQTLVDGQS